MEKHTITGQPLRMPSSQGLTVPFPIPILGRCARNPGKLKEPFGEVLLARPLKWSRDLHLLRERASRSRTETWSRTDIEQLFGIGRASAQSLMKAIGEVQAVAGAHFVERPALLAFLNT